MIALIKWNIWQKRWGIMWWIIGAVSLIFMTLIFYPTFRNQAAELQRSFDTLPDAAVQLFGGSTDFFSPVGFLNSQIYFIVLPLLLGILSINLGNGLIGKEEQDKTIDNLLSKPISKTKLLTAKAFSGALILLIVSVSAALTTIATVKIVKLDIPLSRIFAISLICYLLNLSFGAVAFAISATGRARVASVGVSMTVALGGYLLTSLSGTVKWLSTPSKILPFDYYRSEEILQGTYRWRNIIYFICLIAICGFVSWFSFRKRDLS